MKTYAEWSAFVRNRDGQCLNCGCIEDLHAHHILPKSTHPDKRLDVDNGMTLCYRCHKKEHEKNRSVRINRALHPHRKTLIKRIEELERINHSLAKQIVGLEDIHEKDIEELASRLRAQTKHLNECNRGPTALDAIRGV